MKFEIISSVFKDGAPIPSKYTCEGEDISPPLSWRGIPGGTKSLVLLLDDPDSAKAPWSHWVVYNIPTDRYGLPEGLLPKKILPWGGLQGINDFNKPGYGGPCPKVGLHHYYFRFYALDQIPDLPPGAVRREVLDHTRNHVIDMTELVGTYKLQGS